MSQSTAEQMVVRLYLDSKEYIRWLAIANRKRTTAAGLARWLALEYMVRQEAHMREAEQGENPPNTPSK